MTAILSLFLSLAMLFSGGPLPETADLASTLTVQDIVVGYNGESYPLGFDIALSAAAGRDELSLHFEAVDGEDVYLPLSGKITPDSAVFTLSEEGSAYTVTAETLNQLLGLEEGDVSSMESVLGGLESYISTLAALSKKQPVKLTPEQEAQLMEVVYSNMDDMVREDMNWDFGSGEIPAEHVNGMISGADLFAILDGWMALDDENLAPVLSAVLDLYDSIIAANYAVISQVNTTVEIADSTIGVIGGADGPTAVYVAGEEPAEEPAEEIAEYVPAESFTQLLENLAAGDEEVLAELEALETEMDIITAADGDVNYAIVNLYAAFDENLESVMNITAETTSSPEETLAYFALYLEQGSTSLGYEVNTTVDGPVENPAAVNMEVMMQTDNELDFTDYDAEEVEENILYNSGSVYVSAGSVFTDGLEDTDLYMEISETNVRYANGELSEEDEGQTVSVSYFADEEEDENGGVIGTHDLSVSAGDEAESYTLHFTTLNTQAPAEDYFAGRSAVNLPADGEDPAYQTLSAEALLLMSDAMSLAADEEFAALMAAFTAVEDTAEYEEDYEEDYEEEYYEEDYVEEMFASFDEVNAAYPGVFVSYTAPEGFEADVITVSNGEYLYANYYSEDGRYISVNQSCYEDTGLDYFAVNNGEVSLIEGQTAAVYKTDAGYYYAQFYLDNSNLYLYFDDCDAAALQTILAGLQF